MTTTAAAPIVVRVPRAELMRHSMVGAQAKIHRLLREAGVPLSSTIELVPDRGVLESTDDFDANVVIFTFREAVQ